MKGISEWRKRLGVGRTVQQAVTVDETEIQARNMQTINEMLSMQSAGRSTGEDIQMSDDLPIEEGDDTAPINPHDLTDTEYLPEAHGGADDDEEEKGGEKIASDLGEEAKMQGLDYEETQAEGGRKEWLLSLPHATSKDILSPAVVAVLTQFEDPEEISHSTSGNLQQNFFSDSWTSSTKPCAAIQDTRRLGSKLSDSTALSRRARTALLSANNGTSQPRSLLLITPGAGGSGVNLTAASQIIMCEP